MITGFNTPTHNSQYYTGNLGYDGSLAPVHYGCSMGEYIHGVQVSGAWRGNHLDQVKCHARDSFEHLCWMVSLMMPPAVEFSVHSYVASCGCPISMSVALVALPSLALRKVAPISDSATKDINYLSTVEMQRRGSSVRGGGVLLMLMQFLSR
jgi:hypothetical protein